MRRSTCKKSRCSTRVELSRADIVQLLKSRVAMNMIGDVGMFLPGAQVNILMRVPGGGDWSNTDLEVDDIDRFLTIIVSYEEEEKD